MSSACNVKELPCSDTSTCESKFKNKGCKCVTIQGDKCQPIKTTCAYEDNGVLYGCSVGCCGNQCGGQCPTGSNVDLSGVPLIVGSVSRVDIYIVALLILLLTLILITTVMLF